jgi:hypothetical protein
MDSGQIVSVMIALLPAFLISTIVYAAIVKWLERTLTFTQCLLMSAVASAVSIGLYVGYLLVRAPFYRNKDLDNVAALVAWCVLGILITRLARNYGIKKQGWFGVGGKANFWLLAILWGIIIVVLGVKYLLGN